MAARLGVALGGGGSRGVAHIGVLRALDEAGVPIHAIAGISAGALSAAGYCLDGRGRGLETALSRSSAILALYRDHLQLAASNTVGRLFAEMAGDARIEDCTPALAIATADVHTRESVVLRSGRVVDALQASIAIPFIGRPVELDGRYFADCGRDSHVLREALREMGADVILEVSLFMDSESDVPPPIATVLRPVLRRLNGPPSQPPGRRDLLRFTLDLALRPPVPIPPADLLIAPHLPSVPTLARDGLRRARLAGYNATRAALPRLEALLYGSGDDYAAAAG